MKHDHPPIEPHGHAPEGHKAKVHHEAVMEQHRKHGGPAHVKHHSDHWAQHSAGHTPHHEHMAKMCKGGKM